MIAADLAGLLSPRTLAGMALEHPAPPSPDGKVDIDTVLKYICPDCDEEHDRHDQAVKCCASVRAAGRSEGPTGCPVCGAGCKDHHDAANCCLWKDLTPLARFNVANAVERGAEWPDAIAAHGAAS